MNTIGFIIGLIVSLFFIAIIILIQGGTLDTSVKEILTYALLFCAGAAPMVGLMDK